MGSLPMNGNTMSKLVSIPSSTFGAISCLFRERPKIRSPIQSPPLQKRIMHLVETGKVASKTSGDTLTRHSGNQENEGRNKENKPILKNGSPCRARSRVDHNRKVNFRPKVVVFHFDREQGGHVRCESQRLSSDPEVTTSAVDDLFHRQNNAQATTFPSPGGSMIMSHNAPESCSSGEGEANSRGNSNGTPTPGRRSLPLQRNRDEPLPVVNDLQFQQFVDDSRNSFLRFSLPLGPGTSANDVIVKANKDGDRIRVFSGNGPVSSSSQDCREVCERFALPVRVDSYQISARIDSSGVLFVEAPILQGELLKPGLHFVRKAV